MTDGIMLLVLLLYADLKLLYVQHAFCSACYLCFINVLNYM